MPAAIVDHSAASLYGSLVELLYGWKHYKDYEESRIRYML